MRPMTALNGAAPTALPTAAQLKKAQATILAAIAALKLTHASTPPVAVSTTNDDATSDYMNLLAQSKQFDYTNYTATTVLTALSSPVHSISSPFRVY